MTVKCLEQTINFSICIASDKPWANKTMIEELFLKKLIKLVAYNEIYLFNYFGHSFCDKFFVVKNIDVVQEWGISRQFANARKEVCFYNVYVSLCIFEYKLLQIQDPANMMVDEEHRSKLENELKLCLQLFIMKKIIYLETTGKDHSKSKLLCLLVKIN